MRLYLLVALLLASAAADAASPTPFGEGSWQTLVQAHAGRPAIVHFWGVTCEPCQVELPKWGKLLRQRPDLPLVLIEADAVPVNSGRIDGILRKAGLAKAESWMLVNSDDRLRYQIDPDWAGELPMTLLIGCDGKITRILGIADFDRVGQWLAGQATEHACSSGRW